MKETLKELAEALKTCKQLLHHNKVMKEDEAYAHYIEDLVDKAHDEIAKREKVEEILKNPFFAN